MIRLVVDDAVSVDNSVVAMNLKIMEFLKPWRFDFVEEIPTRLNYVLPLKRVTAVISCQKGSGMQCLVGTTKVKRLSVGWRSFVMDDNLKVGDGCVFELMNRKKLEFKVHIVDGSIPEEFSTAAKRKLQANAE